jgi:hypothetical protein
MSEISSKIKCGVKMSIIIVSIIVAIAAAIGIGSQIFSSPDNQVEEVCEEVIKLETGADIDLSPSTIEKQILDAPVENGLPANIDVANTSGEKA